MSDEKKTSNKTAIVGAILAAAGYMVYHHVTTKSIDATQLTQSWNCERRNDDDPVVKRLFRFDQNGEYFWQEESMNPSDVVTVSGEYKIDGNKISMNPMYATSRRAELVGVVMDKSHGRTITQRESNGTIDKLDSDQLVMTYVTVNTKRTAKKFHEQVTCKKIVAGN
jgi:hypothetical protein